MALALYRTYRPGTLADVVGQEHVTEALARALDADRMHHAYLFSGPRGCGKTSTARIVARSLNCEQGPTSTPCGSCRSCLDLAPNGPGSIDVVELDAATHRGIDDARELREKAIYAPAASRFRVYIIDEAHQLTPEASNALLKLIEEPPSHLRFIFATTEPDKIIATIRSRTFHYPFRLVPGRILTEHLHRVCEAEGVAAEPAALAVVARAGAGSVRDSLSVLGQLLAGVGPQGLTHTEAVAALGLTDDVLIDGFVDALSAGSAAEMLHVVDGVISAGHDPRRFVSDVLDRLRDLVVLRADPSALESGLIDLPDEAAERLAAQAQTLSLAELSHAADQVSAGLSEVKGATAPRLQLELLCARLALHHPGDTLGAVLARLERLEREVAGGARPSAPAAVRDGAPTPQSARAGRPEQTASDEPELEDAAGSPPGAVEPVTGAAPAVVTEPLGESAPSAARGPESHAGGAGAATGRTPPTPPRRPTLSSRRPAPAGASGGPGQGSGADASPSDSPEAEGSATHDTSAQPTGGSRGPSAAQAALARVTQAWPTVLDKLAQGSRVAWTVFAEATPLSLSEGALAVAVPDPGVAAAITQRGHDVRLREALLEVLQLDVTIDVVLDAGASARSSGGSASSPAGAWGGGSRATGATPSARPSASFSGSRSAASPGSRAGDVDATGTPPAGEPPSGPRSPGAPGAPGSAPVVSTAEPALQGADPGNPVGGRPRRGLAAVPAEEPAEPDEPSDDDPDVDDVDGLALVTRELGARTISEIEHG